MDFLSEKRGDAALVFKNEGKGNVVALFQNTQIFFNIFSSGVKGNAQDFFFIAVDGDIKSIVLLFRGEGENELLGKNLPELFFI